ncbi:MAG: hypothetical protein EP329_13425 [Deltaproteobacteria bacterium]|nr:MAG: hypothetical protein EP329_13425 [Deltaproteobacteria bacterium]
MSLTPPRSPRLRDLVAFDARHALPIVWRVLRGRLGRVATARVVARYLAASLGRDPLRGVAPSADPREPMTRYQLRSLLRLEQALAGLAGPLATDLLREVACEVGAAFIAATHPPSHAEWARAGDAERRAFAEGLLRYFPNADGAVVGLAAGALDFDISRCRFAELTRELGRPDLAPLFCAADTRYYARPGHGTLHRAETLAAGDARCAFRIRFGDTGDPTP